MDDVLTSIHDQIILAMMVRQGGDDDDGCEAAEMPTMLLWHKLVCNMIVGNPRSPKTRPVHDCLVLSQCCLVEDHFQVVII